MPSIKEFVVNWNAKFPLDRWFRVKNKIAFNSAEHRGSNLIDIYFQFLEEKLYADLQAESKQAKDKAKKYKEEGFVKERTQEVDESFFENIDYSQFDDVNDDEEKDNI